jgi:CelD/BcsL family acetyltransferase involved in cellulose biosynthesis
MNLEVELIDRLADVDASEMEWQNLFVEAGAPSPFLDFDWMRMCFARLATGRRQPVLALVREHGKLILGLPLRRRRHWLVLRRYFGLETVLPQHTDGLVAPGGDRSAAVAALLGRLGRDPLVESIGFNSLPELSPLAELVRYRSRPDRSFSAASHVDMPDGFSAYFANFDSGSRRQVRRMARLMDERGGLVLRLSTPERFDADLDWLLARKRSWTPPGGEAMRAWLTTDSAENDLRVLGRKWLGNGKAHLGQLEVGGERAASSLFLVAGHEATAYVIAYDQRFAQTSPGRILMLRMLEYLSDRGVTACDMMKGSYDWKVRLRTGTRSIERVRLRPR